MIPTAGMINRLNPNMVKMVNNIEIARNTDYLLGLIGVSAFYEIQQGSVGVRPHTIVAA